LRLPDEQREQFTELLGHIYASVRWSKMHTSKNAWDIWNHRVRAAATRPTLGAMVSRLCNQLGLQSIPQAAAALCEELRPYENELLALAYSEHIPTAMRAVMKAKAMYPRKPKKEKEEEQDNEL